MEMVQQIVCSFLQAAIARLPLIWHYECALAQCPTKVEYIKCRGHPLCTLGTLSKKCALGNPPVLTGLQKKDPKSLHG